LEGTYSGIGYFPVLHRDVEVNADKDALGIEINVGNGEFVRERHCFGLGMVMIIASTPIYLPEIASQQLRNATTSARRGLLLFAPLLLLATVPALLRDRISALVSYLVIT
jgi:hypothetical protein